MENFEIGRKCNKSGQKKQEHDFMGAVSVESTGRNAGRDTGESTGRTVGKSTEKDTLNMSVSPICQKDGKKIAYVSFSDGEREAEGEIPSCKIIRNKGFEPDEVDQLENYLKKELSSLKSMAAKINVFDAFLGRKP